MDLLKEFGIKEDSRFIRARKEAFRILILIIVETCWVFAFVYWGIKADVSQYTYIGGLPMWFFWSLLGIAVIFPIWAVILAIKTEECKLTSEINDKNYEKDYVEKSSS